MTKYNNKTITCFPEDKKVIRRMKKVYKFKSTNQVIQYLISMHLSQLPYEKRVEITGVRYDNRY